MQIRLYLDEDAMDSDLVRALRLRGVDVTTALDAGLIGSADEEHLQYATASTLTLYCFNVSDFMSLHTSYLAVGRAHTGIILGQQQRYSVGEQMRRLVRLVQMRSAESLRNTIEFLSSWGWTRAEILEFPGSSDGPWARYVSEANERGIGTVRYPRIIPKDDTAAELLAKRTLTNLYNERPTWLDLAHRKLDEAVFAAYGWEPTLSDDEILTRLLALNQQRTAAA